MAVSRLIAEIEVKNGELAIKQVRGFSDAVDQSGKAGSRASKGIGEQEKHTSKLSKASENWLGVGAKMAAGLGALYVAAKAVKEAIGFEAQEKTAGNLLKNLHEAHSGHLQAMVRASESASEHGGFSKEEEFAGIENALGVTHRATAAIKAHAEAVDLAREKGIGLAKAETAVNQALVGKTGRLQKLLGIIQPYTKYATELSLREKENKGFYASDAEKKHAELLDQIQTREEALHKIEGQGAGARTAYAHSLKGEWEDLKHTASNLMEALGKGLLPAFKSVVGELMKVVEWAKRNWSWFGKLVFVVLGVAVAVRALSKAQAIYGDLQKAGTAVTKVFQTVLMQQTEASRLAQVNEDLRAASTTAATDATEGATVASYEFDAANALWIGGLVVGIAVVMLIVTHLKLFKRIGLDAFHWVEQAGVDAFHWIEKAGENAWAWIKALPGRISHAFSDLGRLIAKPFEDAWRKIPAPLRGVIGGAAHLVGGAIHAVSSIIPHFATGGVVPGYGFGDSIPAMLTPGEFVLNRQAVSSLGVGTLNALNSGWRGRNAEAQEYVPVQVINKMDSRVLSESTTRYALKKKRGS